MNKIVGLLIVLYGLSYAANELSFFLDSMRWFAKVIGGL
jgi:hypothetical protein